MQLKGRLTIDKKYSGKNLEMAFPIEGRWYVVEHDVLVEAIGRLTTFLDTDSWKVQGGYSVARPSRALREWLEPYELGHATMHTHEDSA